MNGTPTTGGTTTAGCETREILGIATGFESDSVEVSRVAAGAFAAWPLSDAEARVTVRIDVGAGSTKDSPRAPIDYTLMGRSRVRISTPGSEVIADSASRHAHGRVTGQLLADAEHFRYGVLEAATLFLLTHLDRVPFHAAAISGGEHAILLAGHSGVGKSTLAYALMSHEPSSSLLADDAVYIETGARPRIWGWPGFLHLEPAAAGYFAELRAREPEVVANGKRKIALATSPLTLATRSRKDDASWRESAVPRTALSVDRASVVLLQRGGGRPRLEQLESGEAARALTESIEPGFDRFGDLLPAALRPFLEPHAWILDSGSDPHEAAALLLRSLGPT